MIWSNLICPYAPSITTSVSGKTAEVELKDGLGTAKFNSTTQSIDNTSTITKSRFPLPKSERPGSVRKALVSFVPSLNPQMLLGQADDMSDDSSSDSTTVTTFYVDSGAGQCLRSCSTAFHTIEACHIQVVGVAGRLSIHGFGTAVFLVSVDGREAIL